LQNASVWQKARLPRERSEPDAVVLDHGELTGPVGATRKGSEGGSSGIVWRGERNPEEHHSNRSRQAAVKCELAKVLVECHQYASVLLRAFQDLGVRATGGILKNPHNVVSLLSKSGDDGAGNVLVGKQPGGHV
jgi:hypothetical protein